MFDDTDIRDQSLHLERNHNRLAPSEHEPNLTTNTTGVLIVVGDFNDLSLVRT